MASQRDAVYSAVIAVAGEMKPGKPVQLTSDQKNQVHQLVTESFISGETSFKGEVTPEAIKKYVPGLCNNWIRKDKRLNGGEKYVPKNPGSRAGSGDEALKAMKALLAATTDAKARTEIETEIDKRKLELKPRQEINASALPESLRHLVPQKS